jgi:hypothetical protein
MQDEGVNVGPKFGDDELHALGHQAGDEVYVAAETVELGHGNGTAATASLCQGSGKLWAAVKGVGTLAALDLYKLTDRLEALGRREARKGFALRLDPEPGAALGCRRYADVGDDWSCHVSKIITDVLIFDNIKLDGYVATQTGW